MDGLGDGACARTLLSVPFLQYHSLSFPSASSSLFLSGTVTTHTLPLKAAGKVPFFGTESLAFPPAMLQMIYSDEI